MITGGIILTSFFSINSKKRASHSQAEVLHYNQV